MGRVRAAVELNVYSRFGFARLVRVQWHKYCIFNFFLNWGQFVTFKYGEFSMYRNVSIVLGLVLSLLNSGKVIAQNLKTQVLNSQQLAGLRISQPNLLKGIEIKNEQILVIQQDDSNQIINLSIFDDHNMAGNHVDGVGSAL